jgi:hypothetical protein
VALLSTGDKGLNLGDSGIDSGRYELVQGYRDVSMTSVAWVKVAEHTRSHDSSNLRSSQKVDLLGKIEYIHTRWRLKALFIGKRVSFVLNWAWTNAGGASGLEVNPELGRHFLIDSSSVLQRFAARQYHVDRCTKHAQDLDIPLEFGVLAVYYVLDSTHHPVQ